MKPEQVLHNWDIPELASISSESIKRANSGLLNKTFLIRTLDNNNAENLLYVLQLVHPAVSMNGSMSNYFHVTHFLREQGLQTQTMLRTKDGSLWVEDDGEQGDMVGPEENTWRWRLMQGVEGFTYETCTGNTMAEEAGKVLGEVDTALAKYPKALDSGRKSHNYKLWFDILNQYQERFAADADEQIREAALLLHTEIPKLFLPDDLPASIIHADPKTSNFLFDENGNGIGMIDYDTLQVLSPLYEVADAVRSWCGGLEDDPNNSFNSGIYEALMRGYLTTSKGLLSEREIALIPQACKLVMLGLATRFLNDYLDDSYFGWDETRYNTRKAHNKARALGQISLYKSYLKA